MRYKHIIFDIDGTLIDTEYAVIQSLRKTIKEIMGKDISEDMDLKFVLGITGKDALTQLKIENVEEALEKWNSNMKNYFDTVQPFNGIVHCLESLYKQGITLGIVTTKNRTEYESDFSPFGIDSYFSVTVCADDTLEHKPDPEPLLKYLEIAGIQKEEALYIGDSIYDMQCSKSAGIASGLALWGCTSEKSIEATYYFNEPKNILQLQK